MGTSTQLLGRIIDGAVTDEVKITTLLRIATGFNDAGCADADPWIRRQATHLRSILCEGLMPKKREQEAQAEQSRRFVSEAQGLTDSVELNPDEADSALVRKKSRSKK